MFAFGRGQVTLLLESSLQFEHLRLSEQYSRFSSGTVSGFSNVVIAFLLAILFRARAAVAFRKVIRFFRVCK